VVNTTNFLVFVGEQSITPVPLWDLATKKMTIVQGGSSSANGLIELAIWHKDDQMTVHIYQCKCLSGRASESHVYVQTFLLANEGSRRLTPIVSGKEYPIFDTKITVS